MSIGSFTSNAWVVSGGILGDATGATTFSSASLKGVLAAEGVISGKFALTARVYKNLLGTPNGIILGGIFTDQGNALAFDISPLDLAGLGLIQTDLSALSIDLSANFSGPTL